MTIVRPRLVDYYNVPIRGALFCIYKFDLHQMKYFSPAMRVISLFKLFYIFLYQTFNRSRRS